ncbi:MAG: sulfatase-like hydrolase/transferase [Candidatus Korarchaeota archaeon]|nr:sulfatase-like hydrolase/transferase [Candidatus Korarchaeota archaeon]NIU82516.1 sulfatase-like hydrolase/transferase [Candidatus Thorarchaeota archaeon]NIW13003.1 sulfatase-like hydrolase/transferase [Candidatus Thorarchaeota archaeon]
MFPNVILIVIDALRYENVGYHGYPKPTTPNIDYLAEKSFVFTNAFATTNVTDPSITSLLSGKYPMNHGITAHGPKVTDVHIKKFRNSETKLLQEILQENGYKTVGIDFLGRWHKNGFDQYLSERKKSVHKILKRVSDKLCSLLGKESCITNLIKIDKRNERAQSKEDILRDYRCTQTAQNKIKKFIPQNTPFFLFLHFWGTHIPYSPLNKFLDLFMRYNYRERPTLDEILAETQGVWRERLERFTVDVNSTKEMLARYDACIRCVDLMVQKVITTLKRERLFENTIIILTSDHGESLTEHGIYFDHHGLYEESIHVPLIIKFPDRGHKQIDSLVQHTDILPTVLNYLNINIENSIDGHPLIPYIKNKEDPREIIYTEEHHAQRKRSIRTKNYKYMYSPSKKDAICQYCGKIHGGQEELYDLVEDPDEEVNLEDSKPKVVKLFRKLLLTKVFNINKRNRFKENVRGKLEILRGRGELS